MKIDKLDADIIKQADKRIKEKQEESDYYMQKLVKSGNTGGLDDEKYERANKERQKAQQALDKMCIKYKNIL